MVLPTGSGKTRIAVRLLLLEQARLEAQGRVAVFLAPTAALCMQVGGRGLLGLAGGGA